MNQSIDSLLSRYTPTTLLEYENALREIVQELSLLGLWRSKFYEHAAFYGGTALRVFYALPRFSEDMDFSLVAPDSEFDLYPHLEAIRTELVSFGFTFDVERKVKSRPSAIESAFIKGETKINLIQIGAPDALRDRLPKLQRLRVKLELDTGPPPGAEFHVETLLVPIPFQVKLYTQPCLFAGKLHAVLCRNWKQRVKGRDFYDFIWYLGREIPCHLRHLQARMEQTGHWESGSNLDRGALRERLRDRFHSVDFELAKSDLRPFISDVDALDLWSAEFFVALIDRIKCV
jgi:predicted nucleotidyltransferase component of viral defense system